MAAARLFGVEVPTENANDAWPKWKIGLAVGVPVAVVLGGLWYAKRRGRKQPKEKRDENNSKTETSKTKGANSASPSGAVPEKPEKVTTFPLYRFLDGVLVDTCGL
jgi:hypothetical protein